MNQMNILFTSVGRRVELVEAFRQAARRIGVRLVIHGSDISATAPALFYCDRKHITCRISNPDYIPTLLTICKEQKIKMLIPTIDTDLLILSQNREAFEAIGTTVLIADPEMIGICRDKRYTADFFISCGLKSPVPVDREEDYRSGFPCFIKPKDGSSSMNAFKVENAEELSTYCKEVPDYIIQPFIGGTEYTIDIFCDLEGRPIVITPRERVLVRQGEVIKTTICQDERMIRESMAICEKFRPRGPITVQLIREERSGDDYYIEINPRFGGGSPLSMKAGADSAEAALRIARGEEVGYQNLAAKDGREYSRYDDSVCSAGNEIVEIRELTEVAGHADGLRVVLFDLDDTLYTEKEYVFSGFMQVAERAAELYSLPVEELYKELTTSFAQGGKPISELVLAHQADDTAREGDEKELVQVYRYQKPVIHLGEGANEILDLLTAQGIRIGIVTDGRPEGQHAKLAALGLAEDPRISEIIVTDELAGRSGDPLAFRKPNSIAFRIMQERFGVPFESMAYVGDNMSKDFTAPQRFGMRCFYYRNTEGLYQ